MKKLYTILLIIVMTFVIAACGAGAEIDKNCRTIVNGDYHTLPSSTDCWALFIGDTEDHGLYLSIYDDAAGNPCVEGKVTFLDETTIKIAVDEDLYEDLPADGWVCDGKTLEMTYSKTPSYIILTNNDISVEFGVNQNIATKLITEGDEGITTLEYEDGLLKMKGSIYFDVEEWRDGTYEFKVPEDFKFVDWALGNDLMEAEEFVEFVKSNKGLAIDMHVVGDELVACGTVDEQVSFFS